MPVNITIQVGDFRTFNWSPYLGKAAFVYGDPPWLDDQADLRRPFAQLAARLLRPGGVLCCYCGTYGLPGWLEAFGSVKELRYVWTIASVNQRDGKVRVHGIGRIPIQSAWRPILIFSKGDMMVDRVLYDVMLSSGAEKTHHKWQQPLHEAVKLLETLTRPKDLIILRWQ